MDKLIDYVVKAAAVAAGILLVFMTVAIGYTIFARAFGLPSPLWTLQFSEYALLWITFLGTAWVLGQNRHVAIDLVTRRVNPRTSTIFSVAHSLVGCGLCAVIFWFSLLTVWSMFQRGVSDVGSVDVPKYLVILAIPFWIPVVGSPIRSKSSLQSLLERSIRVDSRRCRRKQHSAVSTHQQVQKGFLLMEWWAVLGLFVGGLIALLIWGFPVAFAFLLVDVIGIFVFMGFAGLHQMTLQISSSLAIFTLPPYRSSFLWAS